MGRKISVQSEELNWVSPVHSKEVPVSPGAALLQHPPAWVHNGAATAQDLPITTPRYAVESAGLGRVQVHLEDGWHDSPPEEAKQIFDNIAGGQSKFTIATRRGMYIIDMSGPNGPLQTNASTKKTRAMRIREAEQQAPSPKADRKSEALSPTSSAEEVATQKRYGAQSLRGKASQLQLEVIKNNPHAVECFAELARNEERYCGEWAVFYHSYSFAAIIYEVHAAVAKVLFGFPSHQSPLPRLLVNEFADLPNATALLKRYQEHFHFQKKDHSPEYRKVAISTMCSLVALGPEASTPIIFMYGYSEKDISFGGVLENLLAACLVPRKELKRLSKSIIALSERHGLDVTQFGGKKCESGLPGHLLQIFIKRRLLDDLAYSALPYGGLDKERHPISTWLDGDNSTNYGQARVVAHPKCFLSSKCVRMHVASADPKFHKNRSRFQADLAKLLSSMWKDVATKERVATTIYGGVLPEWWREELVN